MRKTGGIILSAPLDAPSHRSRPIEPEEMRAAMAALPTAVTIVSAAGPAGPAGATANAVASLSLRPPLIVACLDRGSRTLAVLRESGRFGVSVLAADQEDLALGFATKAAHAQKWREVAHTVRGGVAVLDGAVVWAACRLRSLYDGGDHEVAVGEVFELGGDGGEPLLFHRGRYRPLGPPA